MHTDIAKNTLSSQVYVWLRQRILTGQLKQAEHLSEQSISEQLGVSATPVREALRLLNGDGLVELVGRRGARVISPSTKDIQACFQVRKALECLALRQSYEQLGPDDIAELQRIKAMLEEAKQPDPQAFFDADRAFHGFFLERAHNRWLEEFLSTLKDFLIVVRQPLLQTSTLETPRLEHLAITTAVLDRRIDDAARLLGEHIDRVCTDVIEQTQAVATRLENAAEAKIEVTAK